MMGGGEGERLHTERRLSGSKMFEPRTGGARPERRGHGARSVRQFFCGAEPSMRPDHPNSGVPGRKSADILPLGIETRLGPELEAHIRAQENLCARLEALADELPDKIDHQICLHLARQIGSVVKKAHRFEEGILFPLLKGTTRDENSLTQTLTRLQYEHFEDEAYADELAEALTGFVTGSGRPTAETLGYMLRGFFESMRRHLAFEREHLLPLLRVPEPGSPVHAA